MSRRHVTPARRLFCDAAMRDPDDLPDEDEPQDLEDRLDRALDEAFGPITDSEGGEPS